jgi:hypothetical protein
MKIYTQLEDEEVAALSRVGKTDRRWTADAADIASGGRVASASVADDQVDLIRTRQTREDGDWSKEVCLFPGADITDLQVI